MTGWGSFSAEEAVRRGLQTATSDAYRTEQPEEFEQIMRWHLADSSSSGVHNEQTRAGARFGFSHDVVHISSPTLLIHGAEGRYVSVANASAFAESIPGARLRVLDHAGHLVFIERFPDVNREVVSFLKRPEKRGTRRPTVGTMAAPKTERKISGLFRQSSAGS